MPISTALDKSRAQVSNPVSRSELRRLVKDPAIRVIQTSEPLPAKAWRLLDDVVLAERPDIQLRVYGFYSGGCDLSFVTELEHVRRFAADCLQSAENVEAIAKLSHLRSLSVGIFDLKSFDFLQELPATLETLFLGGTRSKKPDLGVIARFHNLRELHIEGQHKNIDVISELTTLEELTLRSITTKDLSYVAPLTNLWSFDLKLGGVTDISALSSLDSLKYLEAWQVRGLSNLEVIASLSCLQNLFLQSLPKVRQLPPLDQCSSLRRVVLQNLKGLQDLSPLENAPSLKEFLLIQGENFQPEDLSPVLANPILARAGAHFGSQKRNDQFASLVAASGKAPFEWSEFHYR
jgi:hypothetical protein